jgi:hypothetical protein
MAFNAILTILNETGLMKVIGWGIAIAAIAAAVSGLITQGLILMTFMANIGTLMTGLMAGTIMTGGAFTGLTAAWTGTAAAATALNANLEIMGITLGGVAVAAGLLTVALAFLWAEAEANKLKKVNEGFQAELVKSTQTYIEAMNLRSKLRDAQKAAMKDGIVTDDEQKELDKITNEMKAKKAIIEQSITAQRALLVNANDDQRPAISDSITELTKQLADIDPDNIALKMKGISSLGDAYQKLGNDAEQALKLLRENQFTANDQSEKAAKDARDAADKAANNAKNQNPVVPPQEVIPSKPVVLPQAVVPPQAGSLLSSAMASLNNVQNQMKPQALAAKTPLTDSTAWIVGFITRTSGLAAARSRCARRRCRSMVRGVQFR